MLLPTVVLVGRPNVGKSTLFNRLTRSRNALVADRPGLTRDRHYGVGRVGDKDYLVVDTGGFEPKASSGIEARMADQTLQAIDEADVVLFILDGREGLTAHDEAIGVLLRKMRGTRDIRVFVVINKAEGMDRAVASSDFYRLGLGEPWCISASHGDGVNPLVDVMIEPFPAKPETTEATARIPKVAVVGRPNVGKSTLINAILGEDRLIAYDLPGTTRDSIYVNFQQDDKAYTLIDTAGVRRRTKVSDAIEKFSVIKTLQAIEDANVAVLVLDGQDEVTEQDATIARFILDAGRALVVAVNKCDGLDSYQREQIQRALEFKLGFLSFAKIHFISAAKRRGIRGVLQSVDAAYAAAFMKLSTPKLTRALLSAVERQVPARTGMLRPKLRYAHQGGMNPPLIVIHGNSLDGISDSYKRYLERVFMDTFKLQGTPLRVQFKTGRNPYVESAKGRRRH